MTLSPPPPLREGALTPEVPLDNLSRAKRLASPLSWLNFSRDFCAAATTCGLSRAERMGQSGHLLLIREVGTEQRRRRRWGSLHRLDTDFMSLLLLLLLYCLFCLTWSDDTVVFVETHHSVHLADEDGGFTLSIHLQRQHTHTDYFLWENAGI